ncbi:MAG TPA: hypothetical protein VFK09_11840 [Gemmatimonadales bacterium]|nr:hypothetical protein [Gemmatimonadales bacterium]
MAYDASQGFAGTAPPGSRAGWAAGTGPGAGPGTYGGFAPSVGGSPGAFGGGYGRLMPLEAPVGAAPQPVLAPYQQRPEVEARAAAEFMQVASADLIRKLYHYLEANTQRYPQLVDCTPMVRRAAELYGAGDYTGAFSQAYQAYRGTTILRSVNPELPSL